MATNDQNQSGNLPDWGIGPFTREGDGPVLAPRAESVFHCPLQGTTVRWEEDHVLNPAAVIRDGRVVLVYRAEDASGRGIGFHTSRFGMAESADGIQFTRRPGPVFYPQPGDQEENEWPGGCEDPRIVEREDGLYVLTYTQWNRKVARLAVATSLDLEKWTRHGPIFASVCNGGFRDTWSKSGAILARRIGDRLVAAEVNGRYWMYWGDENIWLASSANLIDWEPVLERNEDLKPALSIRPGQFDSGLVEPGPPALLTDKGIVLLYNSRNAETGGDSALPSGAYTAGQALLDPAEPGRLLDRMETPFFRPERPFEVTGQYASGAVFIEGLVPFHGRWWLYYGCADSFVGAASAPQ